MPLTNLSEAFEPFGELRGGGHDFGASGLMKGGSAAGWLGKQRQVGGAAVNGNQVVNLADLAQQKNVSDRQDLYEIAKNYRSDNYNYIYSGKKDWAIINEDIKNLEAPINTTVAPSFVPVAGQAQSITSDADLLASLGTGQAGSIDLGTTRDLSNIDRLQADLAQSDQIRGDSASGVHHNRDIIDRTWNRPTGAEVDDLRRYLTQSGQVMARNPQDRRPVTMIPAPKEGASLDTFLAQSGLGGKTQVQPITGLVLGASGQTMNVEDLKSSGMGGCSDEHCLTQLNHILACDDCVAKLRKLIGGGPMNIMGLEIPDLNLSKVIFWVALIFLIVAVYEMLNRMFNR